MKKEVTEARRKFADRVINEPVAAPVQRVEPQEIESSGIVKERTKTSETQLNVHLDTDLLRKLKMKGAAQDKNIKTMIREAIDDYLKK
jgi:uncharacterized protein (DUF4415 family)